jgi:hypothetical protein
MEREKKTKMIANLVQYVKNAPSCIYTWLQQEWWNVEGNFHKIQSTFLSASETAIRNITTNPNFNCQIEKGPESDGTKLKHVKQRKLRIKAEVRHKNLLVYMKDNAINRSIRDARKVLYIFILS